MQAENDADLDGGQKSSEVKWGKVCAMATIFGQKKPWCKLRMMMTFMKVKSSEVKWGKLCAMVTIFGQKKRWCKLRMRMTFMEVKGHQRSNGVNYVLWLPYLVKISADASWEWWWPLWRSEVKWGKLCAMATIFSQKKHWCKLRMMTFMKVKSQRSKGVNYVIWLPYVGKRTADAS